MTTRAEFAYAQVRLQARRAAAPDEAWWHAAEASRTAAQFLALAHAGPCARWTEGLDAAAEPPRVEHWMQQRFEAEVDEVASWLPARWRAATRAFGGLPALAWADAAQAHGAAVRWWADWLRLMPPEGPARTLLRRPAEIVLPRLADAAARRAAGVEIERRALVRLFRRHPMSALPAFAHLALRLLDLERLRGGLVARLLFERRRVPEGA